VPVVAALIAIRSNLTMTWLKVAALATPIKALNESTDIRTPTTPEAVNLLVTLNVRIV
jgi:hypothetical protein